MKNTATRVIQGKSFISGIQLTVVNYLLYLIRLIWKKCSRFSQWNSENIYCILKINTNHVILAYLLVCSLRNIRELLSILLATLHDQDGYTNRYFQILRTEGNIKEHTLLRLQLTRFKGFYYDKSIWAQITKS